MLEMSIAGSPALFVMPGIPSWPAMFWPARYGMLLVLACRNDPRSSLKAEDERVLIQESVRDRCNPKFCWNAPDAPANGMADIGVLWKSDQRPKTRLLAEMFSSPRIS